MFLCWGFKVNGCVDKLMKNRWFKKRRKTQFYIRILPKYGVHSVNHKSHFTGMLHLIYLFPHKGEHELNVSL